MGLFRLSFCLFLVLKICISVPQHIGKIYPGFEASQMDWVDNHGFFLLSSNSNFSFGFYYGVDVQYFILVVIHVKSSLVVWTANRGLKVTSSDKFVFDKNGNAYLESDDQVIWSTDTRGQGVTSMELMDSGNLVLLGGSGNVLWESFCHPTDTLLPGQVFVEGMTLSSFQSKYNLSTYLELESGDLVLYVRYRTPQKYWSLANDSRKTNNNVSGKVHSVSLVSNSWNFYNQNKTLLWQFKFSSNLDPNATWSAVLGHDGAISFYNLEIGSSVTPEATKIPQDFCSVPEPCGPFYVCYFDSQCECPPNLNSQFHCRPSLASSCDGPNNLVNLIFLGEKLDYFAIPFATPFLKPSLNSCSEACLRNCSCMVLFYEQSTGNCFLFDQVGSLTRSPIPGNYTSYMKIRKADSASNGNGGKQAAVIAGIVVTTLVVIAGLAYAGFWYYWKRKKLMEFPEENLEDDNFLNSFSGAPVRYRFNDICKATKSFSTKVGQGGFGSVYLGVMPDGAYLAVKKLEGIGQGKKEFRAEVSIIGSVHHVNLVKLKGFCAEGPHRLLVYEYMGKGSLDKWIFTKNGESLSLDWSTRFSIALGTAKGLAYLHEECEAKIVHCDIKPENVLLDDNFNAKVSDFGLAKLMNREDSLVYTTVRGTRGYLAPEWITSNPISEKTDVYSYGIMLLEIVGGRKNYDATECSEKSHFPSYCFKMMEERNLKEIIDPMLDIDDNDERIITAIKVALWCIQEEMQLRPPMTKVVQMLEGLCQVPDPPIPSHVDSKCSSGLINWTSKEAYTSGLTDYNSNAFVSDIELSGPR